MVGFGVCETGVELGGSCLLYRAALIFFSGWFPVSTVTEFHCTRYPT